MPAPSSSPLPPHQDAARWDELIESVDSGAVLVAISSWMGSRLSDLTTAEDIWQETLAMAWRDRHTHQWHSVRAYRAWLLGIARNRIRDAAEHANAQKRGGGRQVARFSALVDSREGSLSAFLPPRSTTPSRVAQHGERARMLEAALRTLPAELRDVVRLVMFEELQLLEVAEQLEISLSTVKRRLFTGARQFRAELRERLGSRTVSGGAGR